MKNKYIKRTVELKSSKIVYFSKDLDNYIININRNFNYSVMGSNYTYNGFTIERRIRNNNNIIVDFCISIKLLYK